MENTDNKNQSNEAEQNTPKSEPEKVREIHHHHYEKRSFNPARLFIGLLILLVGLMYLGNVSGWYNIGLNLDWSIIWPLIVIFIGLSLLGGHGWVGRILGGLLAVVVAIIVLMIIFGGLNMGSNLKVPEVQNISINKEVGIKSADITIKTGAGKIDLTGGSNEMVSGSFRSNFLNLEKVVSVINGVQKIDISTQGDWKGFSKTTNELDLNINSNVVSSFNVQTGAMDMDLDFSNITVQDLVVKTGASSLDIIMGDKANNSSIKIDAGASSINIVLPNSVGARLIISSGLTSKNLNDFKQIDEKTFESSNYQTSVKKINMEMNLGASSLNISWK